MSNQLCAGDLLKQWADPIVLDGVAFRGIELGTMTDRSKWYRSHKTAADCGIEIVPFRNRWPPCIYG